MWPSTWSRTCPTAGWSRPPSDQYASAGFLIKTWKITSAVPAPLDGQTVQIEGLQDTITDVFVRVRLRNDQALDALVRPEAPSLKIGFVNGSAMSMAAFLLLGVEHILTGPDHLLFVLGLLLLVRDRVDAAEDGQRLHRGPLADPGGRDASA